MQTRHDAAAQAEEREARITEISTASDVTTTTPNTSSTLYSMQPAGLNALFVVSELRVWAPSDGQRECIFRRHVSKAEPQPLRLTVRNTCHAQ